MVQHAARVSYILFIGQVASHKSAPDYRHTRLRNYTSIFSTSLWHLDGLLLNFILFFSFFFRKTKPLTHRFYTPKSPRSNPPEENPHHDSFFPPEHPAQAPTFRSINKRLSSSSIFQRRRRWRSFPFLRIAFHCIGTTTACIQHA